MNSRLAVVHILQQVLQQGRNLTDAIASFSERIDSSDQGWVQANCYGVIRFYPRLQFVCRQLLSKPLKKKDQDIELLVLSGLYQLMQMHNPDYAVVSETVNVTKKLKKHWAKNLVNAVLRNYLRQQQALKQKIEKNDEARYAHPAWWLEKFRHSWPQKWQAIVEANNQNPPMTLRIHIGVITRQEYLTQLREQGIEAEPGLHSPAAVRLKKPQDVRTLPGFEQGLVSVQDEAAQLAALLLQPQAGERVLDACAAPGGKTIHLLEQADISLLALDIAESRLDKITQNLSRTHHQAELKQADVLEVESWWDGVPFDRILLDAPCSASGVIRRHPDIKLLRRADDIDELVKVQQQMLQRLWPLLKSGGMLLYATCSVLPEENTLQLQHFLQYQKDAEQIPLDGQWGTAQVAGRQILPGEDGMDGFFYALIRKH